MRLGLLASHMGTNLQAVLDACRNGELDATPALVISNNSRSQALDRAREAGIPALHLSSNTHPNPRSLDAAMLDAFMVNNVDLIVAVGYMKKIGKAVLSHYRNRIINVHPSLLPKYGGRGMYGSRVHEAVLASGDLKTGVSVHLVDGDYDTGHVIAQTHIAVEPRDTPQILGARVLVQEHKLLIETLVMIAQGNLLPRENTN